MKIPSLTVGIPALNEQDNIREILLDVLNQKQKSFRLEKIIVASDGSTDDTVKKAKALNNCLITVLDNHVRAGIGVRQNQMMKLSGTDVFVLLNADLAIKDPLFLEKLVAPIQTGLADLVSANITPVMPRSFWGKVFFVGVEYKNNVFNNFRGGDNWYTCHGPVRAFSKNLYRKIHFNHSVGEDLYSYLYTKYHKYSYCFVQNTEVFYRLPESISDQEKQSARFHNMKDWLNNEFGPRFVRDNLVWPTGRFIYQGLLSFIRHPVAAPAYAVLNIYLLFKSKFNQTAGQVDTWALSVSTKFSVKQSI